MPKKYQVQGKRSDWMDKPHFRFPKFNHWEGAVLFSAYVFKKHVLRGHDEWNEHDVYKLEWFDNHPDWELEKIAPTGKQSVYTRQPLRDYHYKYIGEPITIF